MYAKPESEVYSYGYQQNFSSSHIARQPALDALSKGIAAHTRFPIILICQYPPNTVQLQLRGAHIQDGILRHPSQQKIAILLD
ncbi:MAG: hypothetical protein AAFP19_24585, partial [Bacteroidota bacterium]